MHFSSKENSEELDLLLPMTVNLEGYLYRLRDRFDFDVEIDLERKRHPIRLLGRAAEEIHLRVFGKDRFDYMKRLQTEIEDFIEASGHLA